MFDWDPRKAAATAEKIPSPWMAPTSPTPRPKLVVFAWDEQRTAEC